jgi:hypothetical protein
MDGFRGGHMGGYGGGHGGYGGRYGYGGGRLRLRPWLPVFRAIQFAVTCTY